MLRPVVYLWVLPTTCVGLLFLPLIALGGGEVRIVQGVLEMHGPWLAFVLRRLVPLDGGASAMTFGHVVLARDQNCLDCTRSHERVHVRQCERWGPLFIPMYLLASLSARLRGQHAYFDNPFEREAYDHG